MHLCMSRLNGKYVAIRRVYVIIIVQTFIVQSLPTKAKSFLYHGSFSFLNNLNRGLASSFGYFKGMHMAADSIKYDISA